ncbi:cupin domain-containing protein [Halococcus hamelinensis]|uniref:Cupin n=1 Tax=Halococcus hamelinensis 100A6 TaxID=1132509 RepID=M0MA64_9EURY|nr:cupin domain-containing protein [Halococcus hamelinensis]EMA42243.1 cupin [Halococcus hamelinensis 100A6]
MSGYTKINYTETEQAADAMHLLREPLGCRRVGVTVTQCAPNWSNEVHDHADDGHEEVYVLITGQATVRIDDEDVPMESGDALRIPSGATRQIQNGDAVSAFVLVSAPDIDPSAPNPDDWILTGFQG